MVDSPRMIVTARPPGESVDSAAARRMLLLSEAFAEGWMLVTTAGSLEPAGVLLDTLVRSSAPVVEVSDE
jgi:hypothetical protein